MALDQIDHLLSGPAGDVSAVACFVLGVVAQGVGSHELAVHLFESIEGQTGARGVNVLEVRWPLLARSYLARARSLEALGRTREAFSNYKVFLDAWQFAEPDVRCLADEAHRAIDRSAVR